MDSEDDGCSFGFGAPTLVSLTPFASTVAPTLRRLSSCFTRPNKPAVKAKRQLSWLSLQGRLVGAEEATAVSTIDPNGVLGAEEAAAWELFSPIQRVLVVAVVAVAAAYSNKNRKISQLQKSIDLRDEVLFGMQQKLDALCDQLTYSKDQPIVGTLSDAFVAESFDSGCKLCQNHNPPQDGSLLNNHTTKGSNGDGCFKYKMPISIEAEPEERRMSDLSDWAPSVVSSVDVQLDPALSIEYEIDILRKETEEKDITIAKLSTYIQTSEALGSKRITELEDLIRRKNMIINKLRKDIIVLEQKVLCLTRLRRQSYLAACPDTQQRLPMLMDNLLYDMDSTTGPSSSDSDNSPNSRRQALSSKMQSKGDRNSGLSISTDQKHNSRPEIFPREVNLTNRAPDPVPGSRTKRPTMSTIGENRTRRLHTPHPAKTKGTAVHKRWA